jgi:hypothetical protein
LHVFSVAQPQFTSKFCHSATSTTQKKKKKSAKVNTPHAITFHFPSPYLLHFPTIKPAFTALYKKDKLKLPG